MSGGIAKECQLHSTGHELSVPMYGLTDVAQMVGYSPSHILILVNRDHIVAPISTENGYGSRETLLFSQQDVNTLLYYKRLRQINYSVELIREILSRFEELRATAVEASNALRTYIHTKDDASFSRYVRKIMSFPGFTEIEIEVYVLLETTDSTLSEVAKQFKLSNEQARKKYKSARARFGKAYLFMMNPSNFDIPPPIRSRQQPAMIETSEQ